MSYFMDANALLPGQISNTTKSWSKYTNTIYNLSLMFPAQWAKVNSLHYAGIDGYFRISVLKSDMTLEEMCNKEAYHRLQPYGSRPDIVSDNSTDFEACQIIPSEDQPTDMKRQTALIIKYPQKLDIDNETYNYLILWTDMDHLDAIKTSLMIEG